MADVIRGGTLAIVAACTFTAAATTFSAPAAAGAAPDPPAQIAAATWQRFDDVLAGRLVGRGNRAAGVAVSYRGTLLHTAAFGTRSPDDPGDAAAITDRFRLASISKLLTATVTLQLVADGLLDLDAPLGSRLAAAAGTMTIDPSWHAVTVRQLLSHTSGAPSYRREFFNGTFGSCDGPGGAAVHGLARPLERRPGTRHIYSNLGYCLLGLLIAHTDGAPYERVVIDRLLAPLGITGMRTVATFDPHPDEVVHASGHGRTYMQALGGAGAWVATPSDVVTLLDALDRPAVTDEQWRPLPPELAAVMRQPVGGVTYPEPEARTYGLGVIVWPDGSWGHTGTVESTHTIAARRPDGITFAILVSGEVPDSSEDLAGIFDRALRDAGIALA
jgi:D-alanyl-D-alanine carboxypeptidase